MKLYVIVFLFSILPFDHLWANENLVHNRISEHYFTADDSLCFRTGVSFKAGYTHSDADLTDLFTASIRDDIPTCSSSPAIGDQREKVEAIMDRYPTFVFDHFWEKIKTNYPKFSISDFLRESMKLNQNASCQSASTVYRTKKEIRDAEILKLKTRIKELEVAAIEQDGFLFNSCRLSSPSSGDHSKPSDNKKGE